MRWRRLIDIGLVAWMLASSLLLAASKHDDHHIWREIDVLGYALICAAHVPLLFRRRAPVAVLLLVCAAAIAYLSLGYYESVTTYALALAIFSMAAYRPRAVSIRYSLIAAAVMVYEQRLIEAGTRAFGVAVVLSIAVIVWFFGDGNRLLNERDARLVALTEQLRLEQEERARRAVSQEQSRIARELHDVVAHHMSVISVQAGLGRYVLEADPGTTRSALDVIAATAHEALTEMRRLLTVLRSPAAEQEGDGPPFDAAPGLAQLTELIDRVRAAGATVELVVTGPASALSPGLDLCVYRVIQESLTNVLKHADPPIATVRLDWRGDELAVTVCDEGRSNPEVDTEAVRHGLIGMRERARIYGGRIDAGWRPEGGFQVRLTLPTRERET